MKVTLVIFGEISYQNDRQDLCYLHNVLYEKFEQKFLDVDIYCLDADSGIEVNKYFESYESKIRSIKLKLGVQKNNRISLQREFENWVYKKIKKKKSDLIFFSRVIAPLINNHSFPESIVGGIVSIFPIDKIQSALSKEGEKYNYQELSYYMNPDVLSQQKKILGSWDFIVLGLTYSDSECSFCEYRNKLIKTESIDSAPEKVFFYKKISHQGRLKFLTTIHEGSLKKGLTVILEAWKKAIDEGLDAELHVLGKLTGETKNIYDSICERNVFYHGLTSKIESWYDKCHVFISGSIIDLGPRTVRQAMQMGRPTIISKECGMSKYIEDGKNGFKYSVTNSDKLKEIFIEINKMGFEKLSAIGRNAYATSKKFSSEKFVLEICNKLIDKLGEKNNSKITLG